MTDTPTILRKILDRKHEEISLRRERKPIADLLKTITEQASPRGFISAIETKLKTGLAAVIAEVKRASPSKGIIRGDFYPSEIAKSYQKGGAACLSVLTDADFFQGSEAHLKESRNASTLPVIRKDFIIDEYQVYEARAIGADCILLIVAAMDLIRLRDLNQQAAGLGLDVLVEVHDEAELETALTLPNKLVGINNRDLHNFETTLDTTFGLLKYIPQDRIVVTESGINTIDDVKALRGHGVNTFLVGEALMREKDPGMKLLEMFN